ncbi:hypothetical protein F5141DRAFT_1003861 [Pisolithus sp. B1]|nr:hypothetical protein F5141DRAFT_1003861 [Pisolithus sp. B1]
MHDIDQLLPFHTYSLKDFIEEAAAIRADEDDPHRCSSFERFVLTGRNEARGHQAVLDPLRNRIARDSPVNISRDYDSLIGISKHVRIREHLYILPVSRHEKALTTSVHLRMHIEREVPFHHIPNVHLGKWGERGDMLLVFPSLYSSTRKDVHLSKVESKELYEKGILPTIAALGENSTDWPATYTDELWRARKASGGFAFRAVGLASWCLEDFGDLLRRELDMHSVHWADGFQFFHQVRGVKNTTHHSPSGRNAKRALKEFLGSVALGEILGDEIAGEDRWFVDVGLEFSHPGQCFCWRTDGHSLVVANALQIPMEASRGITSLGSSKYARDLCSHLLDISGCRIEPGERTRGTFNTAYLQMYTTDKAPTYHPEGSFHGKAIRGQEILRAKHAPAFCKGLYEAYCNSATHHDSNARIEVRVSLQYGHQVMRILPDDIIRQSLVSFTREIWWNFRSWRLLAATEVLTAQIKGAGRFRAQPNALILTAALAWFINGIHSAPLEGASYRELVRAVLPHTDHPPTHLFSDAGLGSDDEGTEDDDDDEETGPWLPCGAVFFRDIVLPPESSVPRMKQGRAISGRAIRYLFNAYYQDIQHLLNPVGILSKADIPDSRIPTQKGMTATRVDISDDEVTSFNLAERGYALPPPQMDMGDDVDLGDAANLNDDPQATLDGKLTTMWRQFLIDVIQKAPNPKGLLNRSYCLVLEKDRLCARENFYQNQKLSDVWRVCQYKMADETLWMNTFARFWPPKGHLLAPSAQNYKSCRYYNDWKRFVSEVPPELANVSRKEIKRKFDTLYWIPAASCDKMWNTNKKRGFTALPDGYSGNAPQLLIKGARKPTWERDEL